MKQNKKELIEIINDFLYIDFDVSEYALDCFYADNLDLLNKYESGNCTYNELIDLAAEILQVERHASKPHGDGDQSIFDVYNK